MKAKLLRDASTEPKDHPEVPIQFSSDGTPIKILPAGTVIDHPHAFWLVRLGLAEAADEECRDAIRMNQEQLEAAQRASVRAERGIHPEDARAFDAGLMIGYNEDESWIPGPNYVEPAEDFEEGASEPL